MHTIGLKILPGRSRTLLRQSRETFGRQINVWLVAMVDTLVLWQKRATERHVLAALDTRLLTDMGLTPADVAREVAKPFWRA
ncbi:MAG: DUF1127 domain-containing protein, partial [Kiloniellales bacterium]